MDPEMLGKAKELRKNMTSAENLLWQKLRRKEVMGARFRRQHPINRFIADFYCHQAKLVIEVDGPYHNEDDQQLYDDGRSKELKDFGIEIIRFTNDEVEANIDKVIEKIKEKIKGRIPNPLTFSPDKERGKKVPP
jgi:very-short-patch-repair endonuclease